MKKELLTKKEKEILDKAIDKVLKEYGEVLRKLGEKYNLKCDEEEYKKNTIKLLKRLGIKG